MASRLWSWLQKMASASTSAASVHPQQQQLLLGRFRRAGHHYVDEDGRRVDVEIVDVVDAEQAESVVALAAFEAALPPPFAQVLAHGLVTDDEFAIVTVAVDDAFVVCRRRRPPLGVAVRMAMQVLLGADVLEDARAASAAPRTGMLTDIGLNASGVVLGRPLLRPLQRARLGPKLHIFSPEAVRGLPLTPASHQFTTAAALVEWISGQRVFGGESDFAILESIRNVAPHPPLRERIADAGLLRVVERMMLRAPEERFESCAAASAALAPWAADHELVVRFATDDGAR